jgi:hypothetical protein
MNDPLWTWGGKFYGRREGDLLIHSSGRCTGIIDGDEIYDNDGRYLGELMQDRLIRNKSKRGFRGPHAP